MTRGSVRCGVTLLKADITAGALGLPRAMDTLGLCPPGQGLKVDMETSSQQPQGPAAQRSVSAKEKQTQLSSLSPRGSPDRFERQMREPSAVSTVFPKSRELSLVAWGRAETPVDEAGCPRWVQMRNVVQISSTSSFVVAPHGRTFYLGKFQSSAFVRSSVTPWEISLSDTCHLQRKCSICQTVWHLGNSERAAWWAGPGDESVVGLGTTHLPVVSVRACGWLSKDQGSNSGSATVHSVTLGKVGPPWALGSSSVDRAGHV